MTDTVEAKNREIKTSNMETHSALPPEETERLGGEIVAALKTVFDPEIPADIYELGLIYKVDLKEDRGVDVLMTLTTPNCPAAGELPQMVENAVAGVPGVGIVNVNLVCEPACASASRMAAAPASPTRSNTRMRSVPPTRWSRTGA